jgi:predicted CoA-binding protein
MSTLQEAVNGFLAERRIAVAGVSRDGKATANFIYRRFKDQGYEVFAVNPNAETVEGDRCYPTVGAIPGGVRAALVVTPPRHSADVVRECAEAGVRHVWLHRSFGQGSVSDEAVEVGRRAGATVIAGACPMMYLAPVDLGHRCFRFILGITGKLPKSA